MNLLASITVFLLLLALQLIGLLFVSKLSCLKTITKRIGMNIHRGEDLSKDMA